MSETTGYQQLNEVLIQNIVLNKNLIAYYAQLVSKYPQAYEIVKGLQKESKDNLDLIIKRKRGRVKWENLNGSERRSPN
jgi:hypothetical protein